jgi:membrane protease YdiL (CAAX protease family)
MFERIIDMEASPVIRASNGERKSPKPLTMIFALIVFSAFFVLVDQNFNKFVNSWFPAINGSAFLATLYGIVSRLHLILPLIIVSFLKAEPMGLRFGNSFKEWRLILLVLALNCGVIGAYLWLTGGTPYSGNEWLITEAVTVPIVEEVFWRGLVFMVLLSAFRKTLSDQQSIKWSWIAGGIAFGLLHLGNVLTGVPLAFGLIQSFNAVIWGLVYGYVCAKTGSVYPSILLHAAMNLVVVLF